jgi:N-methylhydantoinase A
VQAQVCHREDLVPGAFVTGPAVVIERETATVVSAEFEAVVQEDLSLLVSRRGGPRTMVSKK